MSARTTMARVRTANMLLANGSSIQVMAWFEDGATTLRGLTPFGYEPISKDEAVEMFGLMQTQALIRDTEENGEWVA